MELKELPNIEWEQIVEGEKKLSKLLNYIDILKVEKDTCEELYIEYGKDLQVMNKEDSFSRQMYLELLKKQIEIKKESIMLSDEIESKITFAINYEQHLKYNKQVFEEWEKKADAEMMQMIELVEKIIKDKKDIIPLPLLSKNIDLLVNCKKGFPDKNNLVKAFKTLCNNYNDLTPYI
jgi:hypothetical protein